ncbi:hypothetical protein [Nocardia sp. XZ_19_369]|uniref:hypothetical protein n=1 Tax=Nocardia sp. XZ_19_369 TaxID=2769487 RepID=UPI0018904CC2|nr:hypothetical protein [Nocardia sp. XZ_19_369]
MADPCTDEAVNLEIVARMPWLAEPESMWSITGTYGRGAGTFHDCLAMVAPFDTTDGHRAFVLIHPDEHADPDCPGRLIAPNQISHARRLLLVDADDPRTAHFADEQHLLDHTRDRPAR